MGLSAKALEGRRRMNSYAIVEKAVLEYWDKTYPQEVIAFFYQKYAHDDKWEWCEELVECDDSTVVFLNDFCEGQTCVKDMTIVPLDEIISFYVEQHGLRKGEPNE